MKMIPAFAAAAVLALQSIAVPSQSSAQSVSPLHNGKPRDGMYHNPADSILRVSDVTTPHATFLWNPTDYEFSKFVKLKGPERFVSRLKQVSVVLPNVKVTNSGNWRRQHECALASTYREADSSSCDFSLSEDITLEIANELSAGVEVSGTGAVKPFGVGFELTVSASVGYAFTIANGKATGTSWGTSVSYGAGDTVEIWQRTVSTRAEFNPKTMFERSTSGDQTLYWTADSIHGEAYGQYTAEDAFLAAMADTYGNIMWPGVYESYQRRAINLADFDRGQPYSRRKGYVGHLKSVMNSVNNSAYGTEWGRLAATFDYAGFKSLSKHDKTFEVPAPYIYATSSASENK